MLAETQVFFFLALCENGIKGMKTVIYHTFTIGPLISTNNIWLLGILVRFSNSFFRVLYFSSMLRRNPYFTGTDPSNRITKKNPQKITV